MSRDRIERRLRGVGQQLSVLRGDLRVCEEQLVQVSEEADECRLRALVSETPLAEREYREAQRHADRLQQHRDEIAARITRLEADQDALLDRFSAS
jgi:chromosome segregation ATPase